MRRDGHVTISAVNCVSLSVRLEILDIEFDKANGIERKIDEPDMQHPHKNTENLDINIFLQTFRAFLTNFDIRIRLDGIYIYFIFHSLFHF